MIGYFCVTAFAAIPCKTIRLQSIPIRMRAFIFCYFDSGIQPPPTIPIPHSRSVWPDWASYWTLGNFSKPLATINFPKSPTFLGNFCKGVKIFNFCSEIIFGKLLLTFGDFLLVTLLPLLFFTFPLNFPPSKFELYKEIMSVKGGIVTRRFCVKQKLKKYVKFYWSNFLQWPIL